MQHRWYVEPLDASTNAVLAQLLPEENAHTEIHCSDGKKRSLWECTEWAVVGKLNSSKRDMSLRYHIWVRKLPFGQVRLWKLGTRRIARLAA